MKLKNLIPIFVIVALLFIYAGCRQSETNIIAGTVSQVEIKKLLLEQLSLDDKSIKLLDANYTVINKDWLYRATANQFPFFLKSLGINQYKSEISDCDKYSEAFDVWLTAQIRKETTSMSGPATGLLSYVSENAVNSGGGSYSMHEINVVIVRDVDNTLKLVYIEPQKAAPIGLSLSEKNMASFAIF